MNPVASLLTYDGLAALALAMQRHHRNVYTRDLPASRGAVLRATGWVLLVFSLVAAVAIHESEVGIVAWFAGFASAGFALTLLLTYAPRFWPLPLAALLLLACIGAVHSASKVRTVCAGLTEMPREARAPL